MFSGFLLLLSILGVHAKLDDLISLTNNRTTIRRFHDDYFRSTMNFSVSPCDKFFEYSCGNWLPTVKLMNYKSPYNVIEIVQEEVLKTLNQTLQDEAFFKNYPTEDVIYQAKEYYDSCMNTDLLRQQGIEPLKTLMMELGSCPVLSSRARLYKWAELIAVLRLMKKNYLITSFVDADLHDSKKTALFIDQPSLEEIDKRLYVEPKMFHTYVARLNSTIVELGGKKEDSYKAAWDIFFFEAKLANISRNEDERMDRTLLYKRTTVGTLSNLYPFIEWQDYFSLLFNINQTNSDLPVMVEDRYLKGLGEILANTSAATVYNYALIRFALSQKDLIVTPQRDLTHWWRTCVTVVVNNLNAAAGHIFSRRYLRGKKRKDVLDIAMTIKSKFREILKNATWMDCETKKKAIQKLDTMEIKIGMPEFMKKRSGRKAHLSKLRVDKNNFYNTTINLARVSSKLALENFFVMDSATGLTEVNAYNDRTMNKVAIGSGFLQLPFYHPSLPMYQKFGVLGNIIAHEIAHGFDNIGRKYDHRGGATGWCMKISNDEYNNRARCFVQQYNFFQVNGNLTLPENLADSVGIRVTYLAYKEWLEKNKNSPLLRREHLKGVNLTSEQLFFVSFGHLQCGEKIEHFPADDPNTLHPPHHVRIVGMTTNSRDFSAEFHCPKSVTKTSANKCTLL